jgi:hypothetical protein
MKRNDEIGDVMENQFHLVNSIYQPIQEYLQNLLKVIKGRDLNIAGIIITTTPL